MPEFCCRECLAPIGPVKRGKDARCDTCKRELAQERARRERERAEGWQ